MEEQQIEVEVLAVDHQPFLPFDKCRAVPQFQNEGFELAEDGRFEIGLVMPLTQAQEIQEAGFASSRRVLGLYLALCSAQSLFPSGSRT